MDYTTINWNDKDALISRHFTVGEATYLPSWNVYHYPSNGEQANIVSFADKLDVARDIIGIPFIIHCWIRPQIVHCSNPEHNGADYNEYVGSKASRSAHILGKACDFHVKGYGSESDCREMRMRLLPKLEMMQLRMENIKGNWIHLDSMPVKQKRFFLP